MRIIAFMNQKGGVGKTTSVATVGAILAKQGKKVLLIDTDYQENLTYIFKDKRDFVNANLYHLLAGEKNINEVIYETRIENLFLLPSSDEIYEIKVFDKLNFTNLDYDFILFDTPPTMTDITMIALISSTDIIIPVEMSALALQGISKMERSVFLAQEHNKELRILGLLPTKVDRRLAITDAIKDLLPENIPLLEIDIPLTSDVNNAYMMGETIIEYNPKSRVTKAYEKFIEEVLA